MSLAMHDSAFIPTECRDENSTGHNLLETWKAGKASSKSRALADITNLDVHVQFKKDNGRIGESASQQLGSRYTGPDGNSQVTVKILSVLTIDEPFHEDLPDGVVDIDASGVGMHLSQGHLARQIHQNHFRRECMLMAEPGYMLHQPEITGHMRAILVDWLVDVHQKFELCQDTLFLAVNILDRFLEETPVPRAKLQLVGMVAMFIASKYEEIYFPSVADFVHIADHTYNAEEILAMEAAVLSSLKFNITTPYSSTFLRRNMKALRACYRNDCKAVRHLAGYCVELALQDYAMLGFCPSEVAAAACLLAGKVAWQEVAWNDTMQYYSGDWDVESLRECEEHLAMLLGNEQADGGKLTAIKRKFARDKYGRISVIAVSLDLSLADDKMEDVDIE